MSFKDKAKIRRYQKAYREANRETLNAKSRTRNKVWYALNVDKKKSYSAEYYIENKDHILETNKKWAESHVEEKKAYAHEQYLADPDKFNKASQDWAKANPEKDRARKSRWYQENIEWKKASNRLYEQEQQALNPYFRLKKNLRGRIRRAIKKGFKSVRTRELLGTSFENVRSHIEAQFKPGMTWENYGSGFGKWEIDHITACYLFDLIDPSQQQKCFHYTNLQPLWYEEHKLKHARNSKFELEMVK